MWARDNVHMCSANRSALTQIPQASTGGSSILWYIKIALARLVFAFIFLRICLIIQNCLVARTVITTG